MNDSIAYRSNRHKPTGPPKKQLPAGTGCDPDFPDWSDPDFPWNMTLTPIESGFDQDNYEEEMEKGKYSPHISTFNLINIVLKESFAARTEEPAEGEDQLHPIHIAQLISHLKNIHGGLRIDNTIRIPKLRSKVPGVLNILDVINIDEIWNLSLDDQIREVFGQIVFMSKGRKWSPEKTNVVR